MTTIEIEDEDTLPLPVVSKLTKDVKEAARLMSPREARYIVDRYYQSQEDRKRAANQERAATASGEPNAVIGWLNKQSMAIESRIRSVLDAYSAAQPLGEWARSNLGIGPVIAAGLLAHIKMDRAPTAGHIWAFAGLDPRVKWMGADASERELWAQLSRIGHAITGDDVKPSTKVDQEIVQIACNHFRRARNTIERYSKDEDGNVTLGSLCKALARQPWSAGLKVLAWKIGESFVKVSGNDKSFYGKLYVQYRLEEDEKNQAGAYGQAAQDKLEKFRIGKTTEAFKHYSTGKLPPAHLFSRAKRRVVKLFLSHYWQVGYELLHKRPAPRPWAIEHGGHTHYIPPPNWRTL